MAIKFDQLLEALDPSLDKFDEYLNSMWIIIPTERRYDELTGQDYFDFARKYGTFNSQQDCIDKIIELAPDRWDAFIPMNLEGINEAYETDIEIEAKPGDPYNASEEVISRPGDPYYTGNDEFLNEEFSEDSIDYIGERLSRYIRRNGWDSLFDYPALAVRDNNGNNRHFVIKSTKNSIIITDEDYKPIYSHELKSKNDLKTIVNEAAKEIIKNVKRFKIVHVNESLTESKLNESSQNKKEEFFKYCLSNDMDYELICDILVDNLDDTTLSSIMKDMEEYNDFTIDESLK